MREQTPLKALFITMALVLVTTIAAAYMMGVAVLHKQQAVSLHGAISDQLSEFLSTLKDAETGQRGYLLTGDERYLDPYNAALARIQQERAQLDELVRRGELRGEDVARIHSLTNLKLAELSETIALRRQQGAGTSTPSVKTDAGKQTMDELRLQIGKLIGAEDLETSAALRDATRFTTLRTIVFIAALAFDLAFVAWAYRRVTAEMSARLAAAAHARRQQDLLAVTLASIGDAVIVTDTQGRISYMNPVAEQLTGWTLREATGQLCNTVFNIINEQSRNAVESPVQKVLREGVIVGLANHTLLICKDGREIPIDDSGAPIREADGTIRGVVLVFRDFTEHKDAERELRTAKEELEAASKAKDQFLAALSHELRTPLTPVLATLTTWEASDELPPSLLPDVQMLRRNLELEARLIDDLLDLTRIVKGKLPLSPEVVDVHDLVESVAAMYHSEIDAKQIRQSFQLGAARHHVRVDPARLQQVFWNILKNATKFTSRNGSIVIGTSNDSGGNVRVTFADNGIGMTPDTLSRLFRPFEQGSDEMVRRYGGLGLGMAISKALMDAQAGTIDATSSGPGRGSTFTVSLPVVTAPAVPATLSPRPARDESLRRLRILLVEDHDDTARVMGRLLQGLGHHVETTDSVAAATAALQRSSFDLLLSDIGLPDGTGLDLVRHMRQRHKFPAVALTGFGMEEDIAKCKEAGFNEHLTKPVSFQKLEMMIRRYSIDS